MYKRSELSECELVTMKCIWDAEEPVSCHEIMDELRNVYGMEYKDTTVYTFLKNLKNKGFVESYRKGVNYYKATRDAKEYRNEQLLKTQNFWFKGSAPLLLSTLCEVKTISEEEKKALKEIIDGLN